MAGITFDRACQTFDYVLSPKSFGHCWSDVARREIEDRAGRECLETLAALTQSEQAAVHHLISPVDDSRFQQPEE